MPTVKFTSISTQCHCHRFENINFGLNLKRTCCVSKEKEQNQKSTATQITSEYYKK